MEAAKGHSFQARINFIKEPVTRGQKPRDYMSMLSPVKCKAKRQSWTKVMCEWSYLLQKYLNYKSSIVCFRHVERVNPDFGF